LAKAGKALETPEKYEAKNRVFIELRSPYGLIFIMCKRSILQKRVLVNNGHSPCLRPPRCIARASLTVNMAIEMICAPILYVYHLGGIN
jgi:hypothetical protein